MSDLDTYYELLQKYNRPNHLAPSRIYTMQKMAKREYISGYTLEKILNGTQHEMKYKNVRDLLIELEGKSLIVQVDVKYPGMHPNVKAFKLSDAGLHYLFSENIGMDICDLKSFYPQSIIFKLLVGRFFSISLIEKMNPNLNMYIQQYLHQVTNFAEMTMQKVKNDDRDFFMIALEQISIIVFIALLQDLALDRKSLGIIRQDETFRESIRNVKEIVARLTDLVLKD